MPDPDAQLAWGQIDVADIRRLADRSGQRFTCTLLIDAGDNPCCVDGVVVYAGSRGERELWFRAVDPGSEAPCMMRAPSELAEVVVQLVLAHAEGATLGMFVGASECGVVA